MEQIQKYAPLVMLVSLVGKQLALGSNPSEAIITVAMAGVFLVKEIIERNKKYSDLEKKCEDNIKAIQTVVDKQNEVITASAAEFAKVRQSIDSFKLYQGIKKVV